MCFLKIINNDKIYISIRTYNDFHSFEGALYLYRYYLKGKHTHTKKRNHKSIRKKTTLRKACCLKAT